MKMLLLSSVLVLGLASCAHKAHNHENCGCGAAKAEKSACSGTECATKKGGCADCAKKEEAAAAK
ncbi:hypothetical protein [Bdellovibrio bacteriovorus]|uniref:Uncharacterized protein n=1 Tax=Bdellovibrio bacteriovorus str. Tiberius TaxID=1069642 RepID=K7YUZ2_BDEBC|nr:hypothetical protein [Bdellovibrio bacteriovorus]AFY01463.1 hypothetical protein Bdt_1774 [Bdellovibrio bacteriovorus str. Tiberius]